MIRVEKLDSKASNNISANIRLEQLFEHCRVQELPDVYKTILYFPIGILLILVRVIAGSVGLLVLSLLHPSSHARSLLLKCICKVLGLIIEMDGKHFDENTKLLVANHVSILDRIAVNAMVPCNIISNDFLTTSMDSLSFWRDADISHFRDLTYTEILAVKVSIDDSPIHVLNFPEGSTTNGKLGLLNFHPGVFSINAPVQPVLICISLSSFMAISPSFLGSTVWADTLWLFFLPCTCFTLKTLPSMVRLPEESPIQFSKRVQTAMACAMSLTPTFFTSYEKMELVKRLHSSASVKDFKKSVHTPTATKTSLLGSSVCKQNPSINIQKLSINTAAETFGKSSKERMSSYQERRSILVEAARRKYLEKHNISEF